MPLSKMLRYTEAEFLARTLARVPRTPPTQNNDSGGAGRVHSEVPGSREKPAKGRVDERASKEGGGVVSKYRAVKTTVDGITFASKAEAKRYQELKVMEAAGEIFDLDLQPKFLLANSVLINGRKKPALKYIADFAYRTPDGRKTVEDVKGMLTPVYRLKRHLMKSQLGLDIVEITK